jgi:hypothetical protein
MLRGVQVNCNVIIQSSKTRSIFAESKFAYISEPTSRHVAAEHPNVKYKEYHEGTFEKLQKIEQKLSASEDSIKEMKCKQRPRAPCSNLVRSESEK